MPMMESKWYVNACYDEGFRSSYYAMATDNWSEVEEFIWEYAQQGFNCLIIEHETGKKKYAFAEDFNKNTIDAREIIRNTNKDWRDGKQVKKFNYLQAKEFYSDLKSRTGKADYVSEEAIRNNLGNEAFETLKYFGFIELCTVIQGKRMYAI
jgi:hypothetical protein